MSISSLGATASQLPLSVLSQLNSAASDVFSGDDGAEESAAPSNALTGSTTASLSNQTLQTLLGLQQDPSTQSAQPAGQPPKAHHHGHGGHGHGGGGTADTLENILDAADSNNGVTSSATSNSGTSPVTDPLDPDNSQVTL